MGDVDVAIHFVDSQTKAQGRAFFPDLAGETFDVQVESRRCRPVFLRNLQADDGILLFISTNSKQDSLSIVELNSMMPPEEANPGSTAAKEAVEPPNGTLGENVPGDEQDLNVSIVGEWEPKKVPGQVRIVQLLSDFLRPPFAPRKRRLAVILSAWVRIPGKATTLSGAW